ncbi:MAG: T9SS type A sorting domain-containing protein [Bacteroidetes bacterium]|nr:T9SS type A sorting domain-containing protein [Bacteroidota bacterium]
MQDEYKIVAQQQEQLAAQQQQLTQQAQQIQELQNQIAALQQQKQAAPTGIEQLNSNSSNGFYMEQNIPNPYSDETTIKYALPQSVNSAYMAVYDLSGKQLATFPMEKGGTSLTISGRDLAAGIYLYSIIADGKVMGTKRMVVSGK